MNELTEQYIADIIKQEMGLPDGNVWISNQNRTIALDLGLYVAIGMSTSTIISSTNTSTPTELGMQEIQQLVARQSIQIDVLSKSNDALTRREEIILALNSIYSEQVQEANNFRIFPLTNSFVNTSSAEGSSQINRFTLQITCNAWFRKEKPLATPDGDYFDSFGLTVQNARSLDVEVTDREAVDNTIVEFNIP